MNIEQTPIAGVYVVTSKPYQDTRGAFARFFCQNELTSIIENRHIVQINYSKTVNAGCIRGLHFQKPPYAEMKLIRCLKGRVWDVAVDLRKHSPTFLKWFATELSSADHKMMVIPEGCAHGFQALENDSELLYLHTEFYNPQAEGGIRFDDTQLSIRWPKTPVDISDRDRSHPLLSDHYQGIEL